MSRLQSILSALLVLLFVYAAVSKLFSFELFREQLFNQTIPTELALPLAYILPAIELLAAGLLLFRVSQFAGLLLSCFLMATFTTYIGLVILGFWDRVPCSCGGILNGMSWGMHWWFNLGFLAIAVIALFRYKTTGDAENLRRE